MISQIFIENVIGGFVGTALGGLVLMVTSWTAEQLHQRRQRSLYLARAARHRLGQQQASSILKPTPEFTYAIHPGRN